MAISKLLKFLSYSNGIRQQSYGWLGNRVLGKDNVRPNKTLSNTTVFARSLLTELYQINIYFTVTKSPSWASIWISNRLDNELDYAPMNCKVGYVCFDRDMPTTFEKPWLVYGDLNLCMRFFVAYDLNQIAILALLCSWVLERNFHKITTGFPASISGGRFALVSLSLDKQLFISFWNESCKAQYKTVRSNADAKEWGKLSTLLVCRGRWLQPSDSGINLERKITNGVNDRVKIGGNCSATPKLKYLEYYLSKFIV